MIRTILIFWFRAQAAKAARQKLRSHYSKDDIRDILSSYWHRYLNLKEEVPPMPTVGGSLAVHLAVMSTAFYRELTYRGQSGFNATKLFYDIAWEVYRKMGNFSWWLAGWNHKPGYKKLLKATQLFRTFPFNSPSYYWEDVDTNMNVVAFNCLRCPVAKYFETQGLSEFCVKTWCALDYPLAEKWDAQLERSGCIAGGADKCDFRWIPVQ